MEGSNIIYNWLIMLVSVAVLIIIGIKTSSIAKQDGETGFLIAGRSLGPFVGAATIVATCYSGWAFLGAPGVAYTYGPVGVLGSFLFAPATIIAILYFAKYMRRLADEMGSQTIPEFIANRHAKGGWARALQATSAVITIVLLMVFLTSQIKALGLLSSEWLGLSTGQGAMLMIAIIILYTMLGGLAAVAWTDTLMIIGMACASVIIGFQMFSDLTVGELIANLHQVAPEIADPETAAPYGNSKGSVFLALPYAFMFAAVLPYMAVRFLAFKPNTDFRAVALYAAPLCILLSMIPLVGVYIRVQMPGIESADQAMPIYLSNFLHPLLGGIITLFILFAMKSTANSLLHTISSAVSHDLRSALMPNKDFTEKQLLNINRAAVVILGILGFLMMMYAPESLLLWLGILGTGTLIAAMIGPVFIATFWRGNAYGALSAMISGFIVSAYSLLATDLGWMEGPLLGCLISTATYVGVSKLTRPISGSTYAEVGPS